MSGAPDSPDLDLIAQIVAARADLDRVVAALSADQLAAVPPDGRWSIKDHLSHLAAWERMLVAHLTDRSDHTLVQMEPGEFEYAELDPLNQRIHELTRGRSAPEVRTEFASAHRAIMSLLHGLPRLALHARYWPDDACTVKEKVAGDTYLHYAEHEHLIHEILDAQTA